MPNFHKKQLIIGLFAVTAVTISGCSAQSAMHPYAKTNHFNAKNMAKINHKKAKAMRSAPHSLRGMQSNRSPFQQKGKRYANLSDRIRGRRTLPHQSYAPAPGPMDMFQQWIDYEPQYLLYPGDQIDIVVQSAPELSRSLTVGPDGRISMPGTAPVMVAGRPLSYVQAALKAELAKELRDPTIAVTSRAFAPQQIFIGGQVGQQGTFTLPGPIGSIEAIFMAGGFLPSAKTSEVAILRRAPNGRLMIRTINHKKGLNNIRSYADNMQLRRGDIIFVPRRDISEVGLFVQQYFRDALPVDFSLSYNLGNGFSGN